MSKRLQFILTTFLLTLGLVLFTRVKPSQQGIAIFSLAGGAFLFTWLLLYYDLRGAEFLTLLTLPALFTLGMALVLYFFPNFSLTFRTLFWFLFAFSFYIILLSVNIFNVAKRRPLPLLRAARTASFLITLFTAFLLFTAIFKIGFLLWVKLSLIFIIAFILGLQSVWTVEVPERVTQSLVLASFLLGLGVVETALSLSFLPLESFFRALALTTSFYIFLGTAHQYWRKTLTLRALVEYGLVAFIVTIIIIVIQ